jgi:hypothetical protein
MKYTLLSKEQFEALHEEFAQFLASQKIDAQLWKQYKKENNKIVDEELAIFSDMVWDDILEKVTYISQFTPKEMYLYKVNDSSVALLMIRIKNDIDLTSHEGFTWLLQNITDDTVEIIKGSKEVTDLAQKKALLFELIQGGAHIVDKQLYEMIYDVLEV